MGVACEQNLEEVGVVASDVAVVEYFVENGSVVELGAYEIYPLVKALVDLQPFHYLQMAVLYYLPLSPLLQCPSLQVHSYA